MKHCVRQLRRGRRDEGRAARGSPRGVRARRVKWEMRARGVEEVLAELAARGSAGGPEAGAGQDAAGG